ncbi:MAG: YkgJ family cysteine cluster protein, partial [Candidatus Obscuribacterales bacterium]|nr:YkgJ family cysteine cluster protein [Candidatus Obscuribacterales bacterium]
MPSSPDVVTVVIKTPRGIRFDCSGCGNCCLQWPVPLTPGDIAAIDKHQPAGQPSLTRRLPAGRLNMQTFTHSLEKKADGRCIFLTDENRCELHAQHGEASKPSMCRLFPYTFSETPDGICASVSFASSGVLFNSGRLLSEQADFLKERYELFQELFPSLKLDWKTAQLLDGTPLSLESLQKLHYEYTETIIPRADETELPPTNMYAKLRQMSARAAALLPSHSAAERMPPVEARPKIID